MGRSAGVAFVIPAAITPKIVKLLPLLTSEHDGEVVAAARAIGRILAAAGLDWHALANAIQTLPVGDALVSSPQRSSTNSNRRANDSTAPCSRQGMRLWDSQQVEPWNRAAGYALTLDWTMPKAFGGRFLSKTERDRLREFERSAPVTNADAAWIEGVVALAQKAAETWRTRGGAA
jgi:hypothetical protein